MGKRPGDSLASLITSRNGFWPVAAAAAAPAACATLAGDAPGRALAAFPAATPAATAAATFAVSVVGCAEGPVPDASCAPGTPAQPPSSIPAKASTRMAQDPRTAQCGLGAGHRSYLASGIMEPTAISDWTFAIALRPLHQVRAAEFAAQRVRPCRADGDLGVPADERCVAGEIHDAVVFRPGGELAVVPGGAAGHQHPLPRADHRRAVRAVLGVEPRLQRLEARLLHRRRHGVGEGGCRRARARAVGEAERAVEVDVLDELHRLREIGVRLAGEADDEIRGERNLGPLGAQLPDGRLVLQRRVAALHRRQHPVGTRLHRQVEVRDELADPAVDSDEPGRHLLRMRRRVADALDAGNLGDVLDQCRQIGELPGAAHRPAIRVHVLPEQRDFHDALVGEVGHLGQHVVERPRDLLAARVGHDAETAVLAAPLHDRHERGGALDPRRRQVIELLDGGKRDVDLRRSRRAPRADQRRQPVQRLRAEHDVDVRGAPHDGGALLARDAAADADDEVRPVRLQLAHAAEIVEHALLRLFAHRAGVEQDDVGVLGSIGEREAAVRVEHVGHLVRVVLVHLAAEGADVELGRHRRAPGPAVIRWGRKSLKGRGL